MNADSAKVMVIDDELGTRESIRMILKDEYDITTVDNPIQALEILSSQPFNVVISDIRMPQMNGIEVLRQIRRISPSTEVIMITAYASVPTAQEALRYEALDYLTKPFGREDVENAVKKALIRQAQRLTGEPSTQQVKFLMHQLRDLGQQISPGSGFAEWNRKAVELSIVQTISKAVLRNLDLRELLRSVIDQIHNGLGYDNTIFFLVDKEKQKLEGIWRNDSGGNIQDARDQKLSVGAMPSTIGLSKSEAGDEQLLCPIQVDEEFAGMLQVDNRFSRRQIDDVEIELVGMLAEYIAIAIKNAEQYRALEERTAELTSVNEELQEEIAERVRAQEAVQQSNRRLEKTLEVLNQTRQQVIQQERLHALGQMSSGITHDFNNALTPILGTTQLMLSRLEQLDDKQKVIQNLERMNAAAEYAANVVSRLREFYRPPDADEILPPLNLNHPVEQAISLTQPKWKDEALAGGITIQVEADLQPVPDIGGHEAELREAVTNLILNGVDAMADGGTISLRTRVDGDYVVLEVADTGAGMTEEVRRRCLEPFFSTKGEKGTGMGLAMVYGSVCRHNGTIDIHSKAGQGTTFIIRLPVQAQTHREHDEVEAGLEPPAKLHVLVVDDVPLVRETVGAYLTSDGHTFELAADGSEGLEKFRNGQFDVVVTDRAMPVMSGSELAAAVKQISPEKPVIMLTGFGDVMEATDEQLKDVDMTVGKPVTLTDFRHALARVLGDSSHKQ